MSRLLDDVDRAVVGCAPTEEGVVGLARFVEAVWRAMEGDIPACVRRTVRSFAVDLETIGFMTSSAAMGQTLERAIATYREALKLCLSAGSASQACDISGP
jgi:hypothetical protein